MSQLGICFGIVLVIFLFRPSSVIHKACVNEMKNCHKIVIISVALLTCLAITYPMKINKIWNSSGEENTDHHKQYQYMTESLLAGKLYLLYDDVDERLQELQNPYDPKERQESGVSVKHDHAYYEGRYYMYFGVVPVVTLFIPLKLIGITLTECQATQIFSVLTVICFFMGIYVYCKEKCPKMTLTGLCGIGVSISLSSLWYASSHAALYCTAITSGICFAVWGLYFAYIAFVKEGISFRMRIVFSFCAAGFEALVFGCRPTIGFTSILLIPMMVYRINQSSQDSPDRRGKVKSIFCRNNLQILLAVCIPYLIVAVLLMLYNYARFHDPFEFGQSYQLTVADQTMYSSQVCNIVKIWGNVLWSLLVFETLDNTFPFIHMDGTLFLFPILCIGFTCFNWLEKKSRNESHIKAFCAAILFAVLLIIIFQTNWTPWLLRRYSLDYNFLLGILMIIGICRMFSDTKELGMLSFKISLLSAYTCIVFFALFFVSGDSSLVDIYPDILDKVTMLLG